MIVSLSHPNYSQIPVPVIFLYQSSLFCKYCLSIIGWWYSFPYGKNKNTKQKFPSALKYIILFVIIFTNVSVLIYDNLFQCNILVIHNPKSYILIILKLLSSLFLDLYSWVVEGSVYLVMIGLTLSTLLGIIFFQYLSVMDDYCRCISGGDDYLTQYFLSLIQILVFIKFENH